jgi:hypothetical protein
MLPCTHAWQRRPNTQPARLVQPALCRGCTSPNETTADEAHCTGLLEMRGSESVTAGQSVLVDARGVACHANMPWCRHLYFTVNAARRSPATPIPFSHSRCIPSRASLAEAHASGLHTEGVVCKLSAGSIQMFAHTSAPQMPRTPRERTRSSFVSKRLPTRHGVPLTHFDQPQRHPAVPPSHQR